MKRFTVSVLCVSTFFIGLGALADGVGARFKSDEKALAIVSQARIALGGDAALNSIRSLTIVGKTTNTINIEGTTRTEQGEAEIAMQLPDKMVRMFKVGAGKGHDEAIVRREVDVIVTGEGHDKVLLEGKDGEFATADGKKVIVRKLEGKPGELRTEGPHKVIIRKGEGENKEFKVIDGEAGAGDGKRMVFKREMRDGHSAPRQDELLRTTLGLLLSAPEGRDVSFTFVGEGDVDGTSCNIINAESAGSAVKIFLSKSTSLPVMISYNAPRIPKVFHMRMAAPPAGEAAKRNVIVARTLDGPETATAEYQIKFSGYRSVGGVQLPYRWTQTVGGEADQILEVTTYELNPANIAEKFQNQKVLVRKTKPVEK